VIKVDSASMCVYDGHTHTHTHSTLPPNLATVSRHGMRKFWFRSLHGFGKRVVPGELGEVGLLASAS
jgi:hypothetical protein